MSQEKFDPAQLSADEIAELVHSEHVTSDQLDLLAAHTQHMNRQRRQEIEKLDQIMERIELRLAELKATQK